MASNARLARVTACKSWKAIHGNSIQAEEWVQIFSHELKACQDFIRSTNLQLLACSVNDSS